MRLNKWQLDFLSTLFGLIAGISAVLVTYEVVPPKLGGTVGGISTVLLGCITQRPADARPTTEQVEDRETRLR